jgi:hypothetical protein
MKTTFKFIVLKKLLDINIYIREMLYPIYVKEKAKVYELNTKQAQNIVFTGEINGN